MSERGLRLSEVLPQLPDVATIWAQTRGDPTIRVALLDGPVDPGSFVFPGRASDRGANPGCRQQHRRPGLATRDPRRKHHFRAAGQSIRGVAPGSAASSCRYSAMAARAAGRFVRRSTLARAIILAVEHGANIINISGGQLSHDGEPDPWLAKAIRACVDHNVLVVAAAGNDGCECLHVPAALERVLPVGATDVSGEPLNSSNWGLAYRSRGIVALGQDVAGAEPGDGMSIKTGTSFAAPLVSGVAALLLSQQLARGEKPDPDAVRRALLTSATPCNPKQTNLTAAVCCPAG